MFSHPTLEARKGGFAQWSSGVDCSQKALITDKKYEPLSKKKSS